MQVKGLLIGYVVQEYTALRPLIFILSATVLTAGYRLLVLYCQVSLSCTLSPAVTMQNILTRW